MAALDVIVKQAITKSNANRGSLNDLVVDVPRNAEFHFIRFIIFVNYF